MEMKASKVVIMHGLTQDEAVAAMRAIKTALDLKNEIAFAMSTQTNLDWKLSYLVEHVIEEHAQMTGSGK
jgi:hypothetical protein